MLTSTRRAPAMPPEERRAAIVAATIPLLAVMGTTVTTKQIADAAGVAEGTIFRVFADKEAVIDAAVAAALDTAPTERALAAIGRDIPFEARLESAVQILQNRITEIWQLLSMLGRTAPAGQRTRQQDLVELVALFEDERAHLRRDPELSARLLRGLVLAASHPALIVGDPLPPAVIVSTFLDGIRRPDPPTA
ncbi:MAG TPA: TetR family transcriptional regulator [Acidimicrobiales bacterium]